MNERPISAEVEAAWDEFDAEYDLKVDELNQLQKARLSIVEDILQLFDTYLRREDIDFRGQVYMSAWYLLGEGVGEGRIWKWVRDQIVKQPDKPSEDLDEDVLIDKKVLSDLLIGIMERTAEERPLSSTDLVHLMGFLDTDRTAFVVFCAYDYDGFPHNFLQDYLEYRKLMLAHNRQPLSIPFDVLARYMESREKESKQQEEGTTPDSHE